MKQEKAVTSRRQSVDGLIHFSGKRVMSGLSGKLTDAVFPPTWSRSHRELAQDTNPRKCWRETRGCLSSCYNPLGPKRLFGSVEKQ